MPELAGGFLHFSLLDVAEAQAVERFDAVGVEAGGGLVMGDGFSSRPTRARALARLKWPSSKSGLERTAAWNSEMARLSWCWSCQTMPKLLWVAIGIGVQLQGLLIGADGLGEEIGVVARAGGVGQGVAEVEIGGGGGLEAGGVLVMLDGLVELLLVEEHAGEVVVGIGVIGFGGQGRR